MSNRYRNPFKIRATEKLETENNFLKMYSPYVLGELLEMNKIGKLWNNILVIRSSPGAGKTSILKVFEPNSLLTLSNNRSASYYKDILEYLKTLEIIDSSGKINLAGVYMSCARNYEVIEDLDISDGQKKNMFFALINARVILSTLRCILNLNVPLTLEDITINASSFDYTYLDNITFPINGSDLFNWAASIEKSVFKTIDSFLPVKDSAEGHHELFAFSLMKPANITLSNGKTVDKILFMFDDGHKLSRAQRSYLFKYLTVQRGNNNIWIAERLEALENEKNLGSIKSRDYDEINLEEISSQKFKGIVADIAQKRASMSSEGISSFQDFLLEPLNETVFEEKFLLAFNRSIENIQSFTTYGPKFDNWITYVYEESQNLTPMQKAILARQVEIIIHRNTGKSQMAFEFPLTVDELKTKLGSDISNTAFFFICIENKIPYYQGFENLVKLSSNNIEQFLSFASDLFELMLARKISTRSTNLDALEQERLLRKISDGKWNEQNRLIPYSDLVLKFLSNLSVFFQKETYKPNAPYAPGVNGFTIKEQADNRLIKTGHWMDDEVYKPLKNVLATCVAYNLLEKRVTKQGKENQLWTVFYLNRWICLRYNLPLSYGGFRHKNPGDLLKWIKKYE